MVDTCLYYLWRFGGWFMIVLPTWIDFFASSFFVRGSCRLGPASFVWPVVHNFHWRWIVRGRCLGMPFDEGHVKMHMTSSRWGLFICIHLSRLFWLGNLLCGEYFACPYFPTRWRVGGLGDLSRYTQMTQMVHSPLHNSSFIPNCGLGHISRSKSKTFGFSFPFNPSHTWKKLETLQYFMVQTWDFLGFSIGFPIKSRGFPMFSPGSACPRAPEVWSWGHGEGGVLALGPSLTARAEPTKVLLEKGQNGGAVELVS